MRIRSVTDWTTREGKIRRVRLFEAWRNMLGRCRGGKSKDRGKYWNVACEFDSWVGFRAWSLRSGYRLGMELDRRNSMRPYGSDNCQWIPKQEHRAKTLRSHRLGCTCGFCSTKLAKHTANTTAVTWLPDPDVPF